jgi:hypothetical protein
MDTSRLTDLYAQPGPFATVTLDVSHDSESGEHEHELRVRAAVEELAGLGAPEPAVTAVTERLGGLVPEAAPVARTVVASTAGVLFDETSHVRVDRPLVGWGPLPDLAGWIEHQDALTSFVLAVVDHEGGDVARYVSDVPEPAEQASVGEASPHEHKAPSADWSELKHQHVTENVWARNAEAVADEVERHVHHGVRLVLLAGDPQSLPTVRARIEHSPAEVVVLETGSRAQDGGDEALQQAIGEALLEHAVARRLADAHELKDRLGTGTAVATGVSDVADAFVRGQVDTLLLDPAAARELTVDPADHPGLAVPVAAPADQALVAAAVLTSARVRVAPQATLGGSPVAALLRWDQQAVGSEG